MHAFLCGYCARTCSLLWHSAHLSDVPSGGIDLMAGGEPQPVSHTAATQAVSKPTVAAVEPERCK